MYLCRVVFVRPAPLNIILLESALLLSYLCKISSWEMAIATSWLLCCWSWIWRGQDQYRIPVVAVQLVRTKLTHVFHLFSWKHVSGSPVVRADRLCWNDLLRTHLQTSLGCCISAVRMYPCYLLRVPRFVIWGYWVSLSHYCWQDHMVGDLNSAWHMASPQ